MYGQRIPISDNLAFLEGTMPVDNMKDINPPNALYYFKNGRGVLVDSSAGPVMYRAIESVLLERPPDREFVMVNTHGHLDHVANNSLIRHVGSQQVTHLISSRAFETIDAYRHFGRMFTELNEYYDPMRAYKARRALFALVRLIRFVYVQIRHQDRSRFYERLMHRTFRKFEPVRMNRETMTPLENQPVRNTTIGGVAWTGWPILDGAVWILEERAHAPDEVIVYFTNEKHLHTADLTMELFPTWSDSDMVAIRDTQKRVLKMIENGAVNSLTDSHTHRVYDTPDAAEAFVREVLESHLQFQEAMVKTLGTNKEMTVPQIYRKLKAKTDNPAIQKHLDLEFPRMPPALQTLICSSLLQSGAQVSGRWGHKRFRLPA